MLNFEQIKKNGYLYLLKKTIQTKAGREIALKEFDKKVYQGFLIIAAS